jgi:hypothetical protein
MLNFVVVVAVGGVLFILFDKENFVLLIKNF